MSRFRPDKTLGAPGPQPPRPLTLAMPQLLAIAGTFPERGAGETENLLGLVHNFAGYYTAFGAPYCKGQLLPVAQNPALFAVLGIAFGGNGQTSFALPDLRGRIPVGGDPNQPAPPPTVTMTYLIASGGAGGEPAPYPMAGAIGLFGGNYAPAGWYVADGSLVSIRDNPALSKAIGTTFGGDGIETVGLPNLSGHTVVGAGQGGGATLPLGMLIPNVVGRTSGLALNYLVNVSGMFPPSGGNGAFPDSAAVLGEVIAFAGSAVPDGWAAANGQLLPVAENEALFQLIGTTYGGDGEDSFALPDLRAQMIVGPSQ